MTMKILLLLCLLGMCCVCQARLEIIEPFPGDIYPFEFSSASVTCVTFDSFGQEIPKNITFMRRDNNYNFQKVMPNENLYFTNRTEMKGNKTMLFATMHIRNVTMAYDSRFSYLVYECRAFAVNHSVGGGYYGFSITVIKNDEIPKVVLAYDDYNINIATIHCIIRRVDNPDLISWERMSLLKDGIVLNSVQNFIDSSETLILRLDKGERYNGNYTCLLQVLLRRHKSYNVSDSSFTRAKVPGRMCYNCGGSGQKCSNETFLKNSRAQKLCEKDVNRCLWLYQRVNASLEGFAMACASREVSCENVPKLCEQAVSSGQLECCEVSCCETDFCNKLKYSDGRFCKRRPNLVAVIFGGAVVIRGVKENLTMNGSLSYDPETGDNKGMNFTWRFGTIPGKNISSLQLVEQASFTAINTSSIKYLGKGSGPVITISTDVVNYNETIIVILNVTKGYRNSGVFQVVFRSGGEPPQLSQRCVINCGPTVIPSVKLSTESICQGSQCSNIESYDWILYEEDQIFSNSSGMVWRKRSDLQLIASTPLNSSVIVIKENSLVGGRSYRLAVSVQTADGFSGLSAHDISTASLPLEGVCSIQPASGIALKTYFNLSCSGWKSNSGLLLYQFQYQLQNGLNSIIYHGLNNSIISQLPSGVLADNYMLNITVTVTDKNGASAPVVNFSVQVVPSKNINSETIARLILAEDSLLNEAIKIGDVSRGVQIANNVLEAIFKDPALDKREKTKIQEFIVTKIVQLPVKSLSDLVQSSSVIGSATQDTDTVSVKILFNSLSAVESMTSLLNSKAQAKNTTDVPLIAKSAENLGTCLNNMLKTGAVIALKKSDSAQGIYVVTQSMHLVNNVSDAVLELRLPDEEEISIQTSGMTFVLGRHTPAKLAGFQIESDNGKFVLPADMGFQIKNTNFVDTQILSIPFNPFTWDITSQRVHSNVLSLDLKSDKQRAIKLSQLSSDIFIKIPLNRQERALEKPHFFTKNDTSRFHEMKIDYENTVIQLEITPEETNVSLTIFMRFGHRPTTQQHDLNGTVSRDERCIWTKTQGRKEEKQVCSPNALTPIEILAQKPGKYYLEVRSHKSFSKPQKRQKRSCFGHGRQKRSCVEVKSPPPTPPQSKNVSIVPAYDPNTDDNYTMRVALGSCVHWSDERQMWTTQGCQVLSGNVNGFINCSCNHLTSFGGSLLVKPNPIDFDKVLVEFKKIDETGNVAVIVTIAVVFMTYLVVVSIVRPADRRHAARMSCNTRQHLTSSSSACEYEVTITTGIWRNAATTAKVALEIYGSEGSSGILQLTSEGDSGDSLFYRGSSEVFVLALEQPLGCVRGVRIGHDNSGTAPSWFLEDVIILETQTMNSWTFSNNQWLALERGDGRIERMLQASTDKSGFSRDVWIRWLNGLTKKHIWVSVLTKPCRERFSRMQRTSCCLSILLSAMLANAMFYELNGRSTQYIQVGPLKFSWRQVIVGIKSALIVAPINILIAFLFEKGSSRTSDQQQPGSTLGKWLVFLAWFLCFCTCAVSAVFTIFYSLVWEKTISEQWLSSMFISFLQDVTLTEPAKIFVTAVFLATIIRRRKSDGYLSLEQNDVSSKERLWKREISEVEDMRKRQAKKQNISRFFVELFVYCVFITVLMVVCYGNKNDHRYFMTKSIRDGLPRFSKVSSNEKYWVWLRGVFVPGVYAGAWYNGLQEDQSIYIGDKNSVLVGMPRVRQLRVKPKPCDVLGYMKTTFPTCYYAYSKENEDNSPYNKPGWVAVENSTKKDELNRLCPKPWRYQKPAETDTVPKWGQFSLYPGGGFVADLGYEKKISLDIIETLQKHGWLDLQTRPVMLEFSAFNPPTNLLVVSTYFYEILPSGFKAPFQRIKTISVYSKETGSHQFYLICILLFILSVLLYMGRICFSIYKQGRQFFKTFWNWVEILQLIFSVLAVVMNIVRSSEALSTIREMKANLYANANFQEVIAWTEAENGVLGILVFLVTLKLLRLIRYNKQVAVFSKTLKVSAKLLLSFMVVFAVVFMAFMHFGILIFGTASERYSSLLKATYFQLELTLGRVKARPINELTDANDTFGRIFTSFILLSLTIIFMNFFIAAINDALLNVKNSVISNELYDLVEERSTKSGEEHKTFFDVISKDLRQRAKNDKPSEERNKELDKRTKTSVDKAAIDFDSISKAIVALRQKRTQESSQEKPESTRRKSLYDRVSIAAKQFRRTRFTSDVARYQLKKLIKKEKVFIEVLENIVQAECDEEETFQLLCHQA